jgi:ABC-type dipeptide/oligopeptide/nickel transport system ATPase subunit
MLYIQNLSFYTDSNQPILRNVNLQLDRDEVVGLVGGSGSGKSTIFYSIFRNYFPARKGRISGEIRGEVGKMQPVFQDAYSGFNPHWSILKSLLEPFVIRGNSLDQGNKTIQSLLEKISMKDMDISKFPSQFSGGQLQRFAIVRALLCEPDYLIMDEPVSGLDPLVREQVVSLILELKKIYKLGILFISHDLDVVRSICNRIYVLKEGEIVEEGKMEEIPGENSNPYTKELFDPWNYE